MDIKDARVIKYLPMKAKCMNRVTPREATCAVCSWSDREPKLLGAQMILSQAINAGHGVTVFAVAGFGSFLVLLKTGMSVL